MSGKGVFWGLPGSSLSPDLGRKKKGLHEHRTAEGGKPPGCPVFFPVFESPSASLPGVQSPAGLPVKKIMLDSMPASMLS